MRFLKQPGSSSAVVLCILLMHYDLNCYWLNIGVMLAPVMSDNIKDTIYWCTLYCSFTLCTLLYAGMAVAGFKMFGAETASQITLNLPKQFLASKIAVWTTVGHILQCFVSYSLQCEIFLQFLGSFSHIGDHRHCLRLAINRNLFTWEFGRPAQYHVEDSSMMSFYKAWYSSLCRYELIVSLNCGINWR